MDLHTMAQVKRLFAWADADDDTRNMELHLEVAFRIVAEQVWRIERRSTMTREQLRERDTPKNAQVFMAPAYREQKARLGQLIAGALHCRFVWFGALNREGPTPGYFVGSAVHVDRARLLYEVIEPDLRLLTHFVGPQAGKGTGAAGAPSSDGMDFFRSRSWAMQDVVTWIGARLSDIEAGVAARTGLADDFRIDALNIDGFVDHLWRDAIENGGEAGAPDLPLVDGIPYGLDDGDFDDDGFDDGEDVESDDGDDEDVEYDDGDDEDVESDDGDDDGDADDFDYTFDFLGEDEGGVGDGNVDDFDYTFDFLAEDDEDVEYDSEWHDEYDDERDEDDWDDEGEEPRPDNPDQTTIFDADLVGGPNGPEEAAGPAGTADRAGHPSHADTADPTGAAGAAAAGGTGPFADRSVDELLDALSSMTDEDWARYNAVKDLWDEGEFRDEDSA